ncbi:hypothetical protein RJZ56_006629 [Blastomyces dermatitidis]|uniref:PHD finger domain-containing protein n=2 Tax=Blastomyces TaxID=229219 RepID=A0A179UVR0_BLAGS|nr:PHD finger domain-containing protein [Blastomyces gilchristii SLH14081]EGE83442.1 PHD finger domain-containing protein [Blastomyces dermatitidis ATCC 18188]EQL36296.1 hypothetical protein BDFG_02257 [Blastomyces dermatitidis ATCC 26199]OAT10482.1 PHD finger domain-containing protein [Blastomyces gilchristii SLH14081]
MASPDQSQPIPSVHPQPDLPSLQGIGASTSTPVSISTTASQVSSEAFGTPDSSVGDSPGIPKLSAATAELLARANSSWTNPQIRASDSASTVMNSINSVGETTCSIPSGLSAGLVVSKPLENGENDEKECAKDGWMLQSDSDQPNETLSSTDIMFQQQPQPPATPSQIGIHNSRKSNDNVTPTASNPAGAKSTHLRKIAPRPGTPFATPTSGSKPQRTTTTTIRRRKSGQKGSKRRRTGRNNSMDDDDGVIRAGDSSFDESCDEAASVTTQTKSGRQIHRPTVFYPALAATGSGSPTGADVSSSSPARKRRRVYRKGKEMNVVCKRCERGHSPAANVIVFCDDCNRPWHQFCHDPPIEKEVITVKELKWFCKECRPPADASSDEMSATSNAQQASINRIDTSNYLPTLPSETKVGGAQFSLEQKRGYLCSLSHSHLVNILLDISNSTPELPIFPENLPDLPSSTLLQPTAQVPTIQSSMSEKPPLVSGRSTTSVSTLATQNSLTTPQSTVAGHQYVQPTITDLPSITEETFLPSKNNDLSSDDDDDEEYIYIEDHRLYPKAGNGFRLPPDSEDLDMLLEDPACTTFSHSFHGPAKARMLGASGLPVVVSGAA